jgi:hypothetical protein
MVLKKIPNENRGSVKKIHHKSITFGSRGTNTKPQVKVQ